MEEHVQEYNSLLEESPFFQNMAQKAMAEARVREAQKMVTIIAEARFPGLTELAQQRVALIRNMDSLVQLTKQLVTASNETVVKELLEAFEA